MGGKLYAIYNFYNTKTLTLNQEKALKESAGQLISILPHKRRRKLNDSYRR